MNEEDLPPVPEGYKGRQKVFIDLPEWFNPEDWEMDEVIKAGFEDDSITVQIKWWLKEGYEMQENELEEL
jgi:hypothetical protein